MIEWDEYKEKVICVYENDGMQDYMQTHQRRKTCCFTGHRANNLPGNGAPNDPIMKKLLERSELCIDLLTLRGFDTFVTGMASGYDNLMAELLLRKIAQGKNINIICAVPYPKQFSEMKTDHERSIYVEAMNAAETIVLTGQEKNRNCYKVRNDFMTDCSAAIIGYLKNTNIRSGSLQSINMAKKKRLERYIIYFEDLE